VWISFAAFTLFNTVLAVSSAFLTVDYAPNAAASGIPEVKAYLNGVRTPKFSYFTLLLVKIFGTVLSVSSGLMVGPEGPLVHLGAIIGSLITRTRFLELHTAKLGSRYPLLNNLLGWQDPRFSQDQPSLWSRLMQALSTFRSDEARRDFISIGAASGFAAAFGAPVGGLLFSMEEASSYFAHRMLFKTLVATTLATFCIACYHGDLANYSALNLNVIMYPTSSAYNIFSGIPLYAFIGVLGGLLGAAFNAICL
jgi:chloride channel 7